MKVESLEERKIKEWNLRSAQDILDKIFESQPERIDLVHLLDVEKLVVCSYALGKISADYKVGLKANQLRRFYEALQQIRGLLIPGKRGEDSEKAVVDQLKLLKPLLSYAQARQKRQWTPFYQVVTPILDLVRTIDDFERFFSFVQATLAYHKYCGGRD